MWVFAQIWQPMLNHASPGDQFYINLYLLVHITIMGCGKYCSIPVLVLQNIFKELPNFPILCPLLVHSHMESTCRSINLLMPCIILAKFGSIWQKLKCLMNWSFFNYFLGDFSLSQFSLSWVFQILCLVILYLSNDNLGTMKCITVRVKFDWVV